VRFIYAYLIGYFVLLLGAGLSLWQAGVLARLSLGWVFLAALVAIGLGLLLGIAAGDRSRLIKQ
jgi:hypothetical protein